MSVDDCPILVFFFFPFVVEITKALAIVQEIKTVSPRPRKTSPMLSISRAVGLKFRYFAPQPPCENPHQIGLNIPNASSLHRYGERMWCQDLGLETCLSQFSTHS